MNNTTLIVILGFYTLLLIGGIYYYEDKFSKLDKDNLALESQLKHLKGEIAAYRNVQTKQYEYSAWSQSTWAGDAEVSNTTYTIDTNPYKEDINYIQDHLDFEQ